MNSKCTLWLVLSLVACAPVAAQQSSDSLVIEIGGRSQVLRDLSGLPRDTVTATFHSASARPYSGVSLRRLLERAGLPAGRLRGPVLAQYMVVEARDGYRVSFGVSDLDSALVSRRIFLVDTLDGQPLPENEGPWRLVVAGDAHGARSVRMVTAIRIREP
jgi:DMSO/TMAO reductase YedYZ molybdopterin-dependent catalytic subunit